MLSFSSLFVTPVLFPQLFLQLRIRLFFSRFTQLPGDHIVIAAIGNIIRGRTLIATG